MISLRPKPSPRDILALVRCGVGEGIKGNMGCTNSRKDQAVRTPRSRRDMPLNAVWMPLIAVLVINAFPKGNKGSWRSVRPGQQSYPHERSFADEENAEG